MQRIYEPLSKMGADIIISDNKTLPAAISGHDLKGINFFNKNNSAQVKTALLLAGLNAKGTTRIIEKNKTRVRQLTRVLCYDDHSHYEYERSQHLPSFDRLFVRIRIE